MKWRNHKITSFFTVLAITGNPVFAAFSIPGSVLPDVIDFWGNPHTYHKRHRTFSHYWVLWFLSGVLLLFFVSNSYVYRFLSILDLQLIIEAFRFEETLPRLMRLTPDFTDPINFGFLLLSFLTWTCFGALCHCLFDAISGSIPIVHPKRKTRKFKLFHTGSVWEYVFSLIYALSCAFVIYHRWWHW